MKDNFMQTEQFELFDDETIEELQNGKLKIREHSGKLTERELTIIKMRFGIDMPNEEGWTLHQISLLYGITRERVRQLEARALRKMRKNPEVQKLKSLIIGE